MVELLLPVRDDVLRIGGSNAQVLCKKLFEDDKLNRLSFMNFHFQRDVFNLLLIRAAIQCSGSKYKNLGRYVKVV